jgi:AcrR family transcriptional regulator
MKRGRRPGTSQTREAILEAAKASFARKGYEGTTMRGVARAAGVDVALASYYFGSKDELFAASLELPASPAQVLAGLLAASPDRSDLGERVLRMLLPVWDAAGGGPLAALLRSSGTQERLLRAFLEREMIPLLRGAVQAADEEDAALRATAFASHVVGLMLVRYVLAIEPLASAGHEEIVALVAPALQCYVDG